MENNPDYIECKGKNCGVWFHKKLSEPSVVYCKECRKLVSKSNSHEIAHREYTDKEVSMIEAFYKKRRPSLEFKEEKLIKDGQTGCQTSMTN